ncbi:Mpp10 protein-domain-containing protein, partial [Chiua virens]
MDDEGELRELDAIAPGAWGEPNAAAAWETPAPGGWDDALDAEDHWNRTQPQLQENVNSIMCNAHGIICKKGICAEYASQLRVAKRAEEAEKRKAGGGGANKEKKGRFKGRGTGKNDENNGGSGNGGKAADNQTAQNNQFRGPGAPVKTNWRGAPRVIATVDSTEMRETTKADGSDGWNNSDWEDAPNATAVKNTNDDAAPADTASNATCGQEDLELEARADQAIVSNASSSNKTSDAQSSTGGWGSSANQNMPCPHLIQEDERRPTNERAHEQHDTLLGRAFAWTDSPVDGFEDLDVDVSHEDDRFGLVASWRSWGCRKHRGSVCLFNLVEALLLFENVFFGSSINLAIGYQCEMRNPIRNRILHPKTDDNSWTTRFVERSEDGQQRRSTTQPRREVLKDGPFHLKADPAELVGRIGRERVRRAAGAKARCACVRATLVGVTKSVDVGFGDVDENFLRLATIFRPETRVRHENLSAFYATMRDTREKDIPVGYKAEKESTSDIEDEDVLRMESSSLSLKRHKVARVSEYGGGFKEVRIVKNRMFFTDDEYTLRMAQRKQKMSTHEQRLAALQSEIQTLEAESVAPKEWTLLGEASARARPLDSLLGEDLEYERASRNVPIVTEAVVAALEERIKARIKEGRFDDVVRRVDSAPVSFLPSRLVELQDTKSAQSLAQIYEGEYVVAQSGASVDDRDGRLQREHEEITRLWEGICAKLDALCNAHYVPKPPKASITTVSDLPAASLESALPSTRSAATMLAPEEVLAPVSSDVRARSELTPAEKRARRAKERKGRKKMRDTLNKTAAKYDKSASTKSSKIKQEKEAALKSLVKSGKGVTVVGKASKVQQKDKLAKKTM